MRILLMCAAIFYSDVILARYTLQKRDTQSSAIVEEAISKTDPYDGLAGIMTHASDVASTAIGSLTTTGATIGASIGGLASNVAGQGLKSTTKLINRSRASLKSNLTSLQQFGAKGLNLAEDFVTNSGDEATNRLANLAKYLKSFSNRQLDPDHRNILNDGISDGTSLKKEPATVEKTVVEKVSESIPSEIKSTDTNSLSSSSRWW